MRFASIVLAFALASSAVWAQEHPKEHPEHPKAGGEKAGLTVGQLAKAIDGYIREDAALKGGSFLIFDAVDKKVLQLSLVKVHDEKLAHLGKNVYFACTDMKAADGTVYDLDFMMTSSSEGGLRASEILVHKKGGVPRYGWKEEQGIWKRDKP